MLQGNVEPTEGAQLMAEVFAPNDAIISENDGQITTLKDELATCHSTSRAGGREATMRH